MSDSKTRYRVHTNSSHVVMVEAHFCRVTKEGGLVFKNMKEGEFAFRVTEFAPGVWMYYEVCEKGTDDE